VPDSSHASKLTSPWFLCAGTSGAVPIGMYFCIVLVWFVVSIPLTFVGGYVAIRMPIKDHPVKTNQIPRHVPPPPLAANPTLLFFAGGWRCSALREVQHRGSAV
jgi:hypothetical protein